MFEVVNRLGTGSVWITALFAQGLPAIIFTSFHLSFFCSACLYNKDLLIGMNIVKHDFILSLGKRIIF